MPQNSKPLKGYVKTSNMYLSVLMALSVGFLGGVLFSAYRTTTIAPVTDGIQPPTGMPAPGPRADVPLTKDQAQTLAAFEQATQKTPDNAQAWTQLGHFYFDTGKNVKAIEAYEKSLALDDNRPDVWTDLGVMYRRVDKPKMAIEAFERALSINNRHEVAMFNKGVVFMHDLNDAKAALESWEKLVQTNPSAKAPNGQLVSTLVSELKKKNP
jgi:cytochrome c-type biogenesis protein CcmH/NrfG